MITSRPANPSPRRAFLRTAFGALVLALAGCAQVDTPAAAFAFASAGDMRQFSTNAPAGKRYFDGACEAMKRVGPGAFLITPGDFDPPAANRAVIDEYLGKSFPWYVVVGNHDVEDANTMAWVQHWEAAGIPGLVHAGPPEAKHNYYSFDSGPVHVVAIDTYPLAQPGNRGKPGAVDVTESAFAWLEADLAATHQPFIWVVGHPPLASQVDMDSGRSRHGKDSVSTNPAHSARFIALLKRYHVRGYICGHTHDTSVTKVDGLWQLDSGHARGGGDAGSPSTFLKILCKANRASVEIYRADVNGLNYTLRKTVELD